jgi:hypothetical protein
VSYQPWCKFARCGVLRKRTKVTVLQRRRDRQHAELGSNADGVSRRMRFVYVRRRRISSVGVNVGVNVGRKYAPNLWKKSINHLKTKRRMLYLKTQSVPRSNHYRGFKNQSVYAVSGTSRCLFSDKYKTNKYSVGIAYSCWMLNWWCITWPVGFKSLRMMYCPVTDNGIWRTRYSDEPDALYDELDTG